MKGLTLIEEGYCNDALNLVSTIQAEDVKFIYLKALAYIRAANKDLAFAELEVLCLVLACDGSHFRASVRRVPLRATRGTAAALQPVRTK